MKHGIPNDEANRAIHRFFGDNGARLAEMLDDLERSLSEGSITKPAAWLRACLWKNNLAKPAFALPSPAPRTAGLEQAQVAKAAADAIRDRDAREYQALCVRREANIRSVIDGLTPDERATWEDEFIASLSGIRRERWIASRNWLSRSYAKAVAEFIAGKQDSDQLQ